jgi:hypothetical protein
MEMRAGFSPAAERACIVPTFGRLSLSLVLVLLIAMSDAI